LTFVISVEVTNSVQHTNIISLYHFSASLLYSLTNVLGLFMNFYCCWQCQTSI